MPKVSVILPTYNCSRYLPEAIESVLSQQFSDLELVIVDDGSNDDTAAVVARYQGDPRLRYVRTPHQGPGHARNHGIEMSTGEYIAFIDGDDIYAPGKLDRQVAVLDRDAKVDIVYTDVDFFYGTRPYRFVPSGHEGLSGDLFFFLKRGNFICTPAIMLRRTSLNGLKFDESLASHEDWDLLLKLSERGCRFSFIPQKLTLVRMRPESCSGDGAAMKASAHVVALRAKSMWQALKGSMGFSTRKGRSALARYLTLRIRAKIEGFPGARRFNRPSPFTAIDRRLYDKGVVPNE